MPEQDDRPSLALPTESAKKTLSSRTSEDTHREPLVQWTQTSWSNPSITHLYSFYTSRLNGLSNAGILALLSSLLFVLYWLTTSIIYSPNTANHFLYKAVAALDPVWLVPLLGAVTFEEVVDKIDAVLKYPRVSSRSQEDGTSLKSQNDKLNEEIEKLDPDRVITIGNEWESAKTMLRETIDEIVHIVKNSDERYCLMFRYVDRLTRADPLEACVFLWIMQQNDVILYFDELGYFDLEDLYQEMMLMMRFIQSREEYQKIRERGEDGRRKAKEKGEWPAAAPYGYSKNEDNHLERIDEQAEVVQRGIELVLYGDDHHDIEAGVASQAHDQLVKEFEEADVSVPVYQTFLNICRRELYTGKITHKGEVVASCPKILSQDEFEALQEVLKEREHTRNETHLDHALRKVIDRFGVDPSLVMFEDIIKGRCPECGDDVRVWGSDTRMGKRVINYRCVNHSDFVNEDEEDSESDTVDDDTCSFEGPLLHDKFLRKWESSVPITCPACQQPLNDDNWEDCVTKIGSIEQTCENCGCGVAIDLSNNKFERVWEVSSKVRFFADESEEQDDSDLENTSIDEDETEGDEDDDGNSDLSDFV